MEQEEKEPAFSDKSVCILDSVSSQVSLKKREGQLTRVNDVQCLSSRKSVQRIKSSSCRSGCSKLCTEYKKTGSRRYVQATRYQSASVLRSFYKHNFKRIKSPITQGWDWKSYYSIVLFIFDIALLYFNPYYTLIPIYYLLGIAQTM